jgi:cyclohexa-1,5-dienecarbonyl-CoA hydratase
VTLYNSVQVGEERIGAMGNVRIELDARIATLWLDRAPLNVLDLAALADLDQALGGLAAKTDLQLLVVRGAGGRAFSGGVAVQDHTRDRIPEMLARFHGALWRLLRFPTPTLAVVQGHCLGGGMELAACCDLRIAEEGSHFGQPEIELGCFPPFAAALYPELLGRAVAADLLLTGRIVEAADAASFGFVSQVVPRGQLEAAIAELTGRLTAKSAAVTRLAVRALRAGAERPLPEAVAENERLYEHELAATADMDEGLTAFLEKRAPRWRHA